MASIPLAVNPPAAPTDPIQQVGQALTLQHLIQGIRQQQALAPGQVQEQQNQLQQQQMDLQDQKAETAALQSWDGKDVSELPSLILKNGGSAKAVFGAKQQLLSQQQALTKLNGDQLDNAAKMNDVIAGHIEAVKAAPADQKEPAYQNAMQDLVQKGLVKPGQFAPNYPGDDALGMFEKQFMGQKAMFDQEQKNRDTVATEQSSQAKVLQAQNAEKELNAKLPGGALENPEQKYIRLQSEQSPSPQDKTWLAAYTKNKTMVPQFNFNVQNSTGAGQPSAAVAKQFGMSPDAFDQQAEKYYQSGVLPPIGRGGAGMALNKALMNRSAELHPNARLAANSAEYKSNEASLNSLQKNMDQVSAFENTAGKNLDQFLGTAKNIVDSGSPLVNMPLRLAANKVAGSPQQAAFDAARTTALTEISKVLNSSNASGVLSDSARNEVSQLIGKDATLKQIYSAANILKQDMSNRHDAYQVQINDIQTRLGEKPAASQPQENSKDNDPLGIR